MTDYEYYADVLWLREEVPYRQCPQCGKYKFRERQQKVGGFNLIDFSFRLTLRIIQTVLRTDDRTPLNAEPEWKTYKVWCSNCKYEEDKNND